jgi:deoxyhypusine synthase
VIKNKIKIEDRKSKVSFKNFSKYDANFDYMRMVNMMPNILYGKDFKYIINEIVERRKDGNKFILTIGAHVIKNGLQPYLRYMMEEKIIDCIAVNGAATIHDVEIALYGETSENVNKTLPKGQYACTNEPLDFINNSIVLNSDKRYGLALAMELYRAKPKYADYSFLISAYENNIPVTVHFAIGNDINHIQNSFDVEKSGLASYKDFVFFTDMVKDLSKGILMNCGSAVILPEVFLKSLATVINQGHEVKNYLGVNLDFVSQYRSNQQIVNKAKILGGEGYNLIGCHEIQIPLLFGGILQQYKNGMGR